MATGVSPLPLPHQEGEGEQFHHLSTILPNKSFSQSNSKKPIFNQPKHYQPLQFINDPGISSPSFKQSPTHELSNDLSNPSNYPPSSIFATLKQTSYNQTNQPSTNLNQSVEDMGNDLALPQLSYMEVVKGCSSKRVNSSMGFTNLQNSDMESISLKPISMYQGKPAVMFSLSEKHSLVEKLKFVLVGKFSHGMPSMVKVRNFFKSIKLKEFCNVSFFDKKHIFIECSCKADYNFIWLNLSWVIDGFAMRILKWTPEFHPVKESPVVPVWIRIEGLPLYLFNERSLLSIANSVGKPLKVDPRNVARTMLNSARVCVELDISKPFVDTLWISFEDEITKEIIDGFWVKLLYDVVPPYCGFCSHIGHSIGRCKRRNEEALAVGKYVEKGGAAPVGLGHGEVGDRGSAAVAGRAAVYTGCGGKAGHAAGDAESADLNVAGVAGVLGAKAGYSAGSGSVAGDEYAGVAGNVGGAGERPVDAGKQDTVAEMEPPAHNPVAGNPATGGQNSLQYLVVQIGAGTAGAAGAAGDSTKFSLLHTRKNEPANAMTEQATAGVETVAGQIVQELAGQIEQVVQENLAVEDSDQEKIQVCNKEVKAEFLLSYSSAVLVEEQDKDVAVHVTVAAAEPIAEGVAAGVAAGAAEAAADLAEQQAAVRGISRASNYAQLPGKCSGLDTGGSKDGSQKGQVGQEMEKEEGEIVEEELGLLNEGTNVNANKQSWADLAEEEPVLQPVKDPNSQLHVQGTKQPKQDIRLTSQLSPSEVKDCAKKELAKVYSSPTSTLPSIINLHIPDKDGNAVPLSAIIEKSAGVNELSKQLSKMRNLDERLKGEHGLDFLKATGDYDKYVTWYTIEILQTLKYHSQTSFCKDSTTYNFTPLDKEVIKKGIEWSTPKRRGRDRNK